MPRLCYAHRSAYHYGKSHCVAGALPYANSSIEYTAYTDSSATAHGVANANAGSHACAIGSGGLHSTGSGPLRPCATSGPEVCSAHFKGGESRSR